MSKVKRFFIIIRDLCLFIYSTCYVGWIITTGSVWQSKERGEKYRTSYKNALSITTVSIYKTGWYVLGMTIVSIN